MTQPTHATTDHKTGARIYKHPVTGKRLPSVTTILKCKDKPALIWWSAGLAAKVATEEYATLFPAPGYTWASPDEKERVYEHLRRAHIRYKDDRGNLGDGVHLATEAIHKGTPLPAIRSDAHGHVAAFIDFIAKNRVQMLMTEVTVWNSRFGYAGTFDDLWEIDGETWLIDKKTGKDVYPEVTLQLAALGMARRILTTDGRLVRMPKIDRYGALHIADGVARLHDLTEEIPGAWEAFRGLLKVYQWGPAERRLGKRMKAHETVIMDARPHEADDIWSATTGEQADDIWGTRSA